VRSRRIPAKASIRNRARAPSRDSSHKRRRHQVTGREPVWGPLAALGKRLTMSQPSRYTRYGLTWSEIAILGLLGIGLLCVVALCVAIALE
jgi:hypothetical protein